jgi:beta-xylosidase
MASRSCRSRIFTLSKRFGLAHSSTPAIASEPHVRLPGNSPINEAFTEKWLERRQKFNSTDAIVACRMLDGCRRRSLAECNEYQNGMAINHAHGETNDAR